MSNICSKANRKESVLTRVAKFLPFKKGRILFKAFIESQFKYCLLVWMFHGRQINDKINKLHERALRNIHEYSFVLIPSEWIAFSKKLLNELASLDSSEIISSFCANDIFGKVVALSDKNDFTVFQNFLLSVTLFKSSLS